MAEMAKWHQILGLFLSAGISASGTKLHNIKYDSSSGSLVAIVQKNRPFFKQDYGVCIKSCRLSYLVSTRPWMSKDSCRKRKKVLMDLRALSTSPQGSLFVKSIPVKGVTVGGKSSEASERTNSTLG